MFETSDSALSLLCLACSYAVQPKIKLSKVSLRAAIIVSVIQERMSQQRLVIVRP